MELSEVFTMEYRLAQHCIRSGDAVEGIRARMWNSLVVVVLVVTVVC